MNIVPWRRRSEVGPFQSEFEQVLKRFFDEDFSLQHLPPVLRSAHMPPVNISENDKNYTVTVELPGMNEKDIQVQLLGDSLVISGERQWEDEKKSKEFHRVESQYGKFERRVQLPANARIESNAVTATYKKGMLEIVVPKVEPTPVSKILVKSS